jgi:hypothetical protein
MELSRAKCGTNSQQFSQYDFVSNWEKVDHRSFLSYNFIHYNGRGYSQNALQSLASCRMRSSITALQDHRRTSQLISTQLLPRAPDQRHALRSD